MTDLSKLSNVEFVEHLDAIEGCLNVDRSLYTEALKGNDSSRKKDTEHFYLMMVEEVAQTYLEGWKRVPRKYFNGATDLRYCLLNAGEREEASDLLINRVTNQEKPELSRTSMHDVDFFNARWDRRDITGAIFKNVDLTDACMTKADLTNAQFDNCNLTKKKKVPTATLR